jgi:hypothetical protein
VGTARPRITNTQHTGITEGTNTIFFIAYENVPPGCIATYPRVVVADTPHKGNPIRVRITVGGDRIIYTDEVSTKTSDLVTAKILLNSIISTPDARWITVDIKDFYLNPPMTKFEYMKVPITLFSPDIMAYYRLEKIAHKGFVYCKIQKGMYGLPQAGRLSNNDLVDHLAQHGYLQSKTKPGLYQHVTRTITFCLVVDDFAIHRQGTCRTPHRRFEGKICDHDKLGRHKIH